MGGPGERHDQALGETLGQHNPEESTLPRTDGAIWQVFMNYDLE
jgi:hypothetical protein